MILRTRPDYYPEHDRNATNTIAPQDSAYIFSGYPSGLPVPSDDHNGKFRSNGFWTAFLDGNTLRAYDWLSTTDNALLTSASLRYANGGNVLTTGAVVSSRGAFLFQGARFETDLAFLNPVGAAVNGDPLIFPTATVPGRIWVYGDEDGNVRYESVGPAVADNPNANELTLNGLQIDGAGVVTDGALSPTTLPLPTYYLPVAIDIVSSADIDAENLTAAEIATAQRVVASGGLAGASTLTAGPTTGFDTATVTGNGTQAALALTGSTGTGATCSASGALPGISVTHSGSGRGVLISHSSSGRGLEVAQTGTGVAIYADTSGGADYAIDAVGPAGGDVVNATCDTGTAYRALVTSSGVGFRGLGGPAASSLAVLGIAGHVDAYGIQGQTAAGANSGAAGLRGTGNGAGVGVFAEAAGTGYGLVVLADSTTPARAAMRLIPQDADPTTNEQGAFLFNEARGPTGKLRVYTTQWESVHSSDKGWVHQWGAAAAGGPIAAGSGNLSLNQITPEEVGDVLVSATGSLEYSVDTGVCTVALWDVTAAVLIATQVERGPDTDGAGVNIRSFAIRHPYTLPNTATRTFAVVITATTGTIIYDNVVCDTKGVQ